MTTTSLKFALSSLMLTAGLATTTAASALTIPTQDFKANAILTFSVPATGSSAAAGVVFFPLGNTTRLADAIGKDSQGNPFPVPVYNLPVTKTDVTVGWDLKVTPNSGSSLGSALRISTPNLGGDVVLANFTVDFKAKIVYADLIDVFLKTTVKKTAIYTFVETQPSVLSLKGLVLNFSGAIGKLKLTDKAVTALGDGLQVDPILRAALASLEWGNIKIDVTSFKRPTPIVNKEYTLANVPPAP